jgi:hypothetical protein
LTELLLKFGCQSTSPPNLVQPHYGGQCSYRRFALFA